MDWKYDVPVADNRTAARWDKSRNAFVCTNHRSANPSLARGWCSWIQAVPGSVRSETCINSWRLRAFRRACFKHLVNACKRIGALVWLDKSGTALGSVAAPCLQSREANKANVHHMSGKIFKIWSQKWRAFSASQTFQASVQETFSSLLVRISWQLSRNLLESRNTETPILQSKTGVWEQDHRALPLALLSQESQGCFFSHEHTMSSFLEMLQCEKVKLPTTGTFVYPLKRQKNVPLRLDHYWLQRKSAILSVKTMVESSSFYGHR